MMKRTTILSALLLTLTLAACSDSTTTSPTTTPTTTTKSSMSAKVDGAAWSPMTIYASQPNGYLSISGTTATTTGTIRQISLTVISPKTGETDLGMFSTTLNYTEGAGAAMKIYTSVSGKLNLTEYTATGAKGTFSAELEISPGQQDDGSKHSVTAGTFDVKF